MAPLVCRTAEYTTEGVSANLIMSTTEKVITELQQETGASAIILKSNSLSCGNETVTLDALLSGGAHGQVYKGTLAGNIVAVKIAKEDKDPAKMVDIFLREAETMH